MSVHAISGQMTTECIHATLYTFNIVLYNVHAKEDFAAMNYHSCFASTIVSTIVLTIVLTIASTIFMGWHRQSRPHSRAVKDWHRESIIKALLTNLCLILFNTYTVITFWTILPPPLSEGEGGWFGISERKYIDSTFQLVSCFNCQGPF